MQLNDNDKDHIHDDGDNADDDDNLEFGGDKKNVEKVAAEVHSENSFVQYEKMAPAEVRKRQVGSHHDGHHDHDHDHY